MAPTSGKDLHRQRSPVHRHESAIAPTSVGGIAPTNVRRLRTNSIVIALTSVRGLHRQGSPSHRRVEWDCTDKVSVGSHRHDQHRTDERRELAPTRVRGLAPTRSAIAPTSEESSTRVRGLAPTPNSDRTDERRELAPTTRSAELAPSERLAHTRDRTDERRESSHRQVEGDRTDKSRAIAPAWVRSLDGGTRTDT